MRILLIEDHPIVRTACRRLLQGNVDIEIMETATAAEGLSASATFFPDIVILDLKLPDSSGLELLPALLARGPGMRIIVFSMYDDPAFAARAVEAGASGYLTKNDDPEALLHAIEKVAAGGIFLTAGMAEKLASMTTARSGSPVPELTPRERQVLQLLGLGKTLGEIADELKVAYRTAAHVAAQIRIKLQLASTAALIKWAVDHPQHPIGSA